MCSPSACSLHRLKVMSVLALALAIGGCTNLKGAKHDTAPAQNQACNCPKNTNAESSQKKSIGVGEQRQILNEGYSLLYSDATKLNLTELILYAKSESEEFANTVKAVAAFADKVKTDLERVEKDYPAVRIDLDPLPVMEKRKRRDIGKDRIIDFAPIVGRGGRDYERTVLISLMNGINHQSHMCKVLAMEEPEASLQKFLSDTEQGYDVFYKRIEALLNKKYFIQ